MNTNGYVTAIRKISERHHLRRFAKALLFLLLIVSASACTKTDMDENGAGTNSDITIPSVVSVEPADNITAVSTLTSVSVNFSEKMDSTTISNSSFTLRRGASVVSGTVTYTGTTATFKPANELEGNTVYTGTVKSGVKDLAGNAIDSVFMWSFTTGAAIDTKAPTVISVNPSPNATSVSRTVKITVTFNEEVKSESVSATSFILKRGVTVIPGTLSVSGSALTFTPSAELAGNALHSVTVTKEVKDAAGNPMTADYSWSFTTLGDVTAPSVSSVSPLANATGVQTNVRPSAIFSEAIDPASVTTSTFSLKRGTVTIAGTVSVTGNTATFTPSATLAANTLYTVTATKGIKDPDGNPISSDYTWSFTTGSVPDITAPTVSAVTPLANSTSIQTSIKPSVTFSELMDPATITTSTFLVKQGTTGIAGTITINGNTATFSPANALAGNTSYRVTVTSGVKDKAGNAMAADYSWSFTTIASAADVTPPVVSSVTPAANSTAISTGIKPSVTFSELMDAATITTSTFLVKQGTTGIAGTISITGNTATFSPANALAGNTAYTVTITTGVKDKAGNAIASAYTWTFTTVATTPVAKSFAGDVVPILNLCNDCHGHKWTPSSTPSTFHANLVSSGHINLTNPTSGKIYSKVNGGHPSSGVTAEQKATVLTWIKEGSKNN